MEPKVFSHDVMLRQQTRAALKERLAEFGNDRHEAAGSGKGGQFAPKDEESGTAEEGEGGLSGLLAPAIAAIQKHNQEAQDAANAAADGAKVDADVAAWQGRSDAAQTAYNSAKAGWDSQKASWDSGQAAAREQAIAAKYVPMQAAANAAQANLTRTSAASDAALNALIAAPTDGSPASQARFDAALAASDKATTAYQNALTTYENTPSINEISGLIANDRLAPLPPFGTPAPTNGFNEVSPLVAWCKTHVGDKRCIGVSTTPPPATPSASGAASLVGSSLDGLSASSKAAVQGALNAIDSVHGVDAGVGQKVTIANVDSLGSGVHGTYSPLLTGITVLNSDPTDDQFAFTHEFGHYLQTQQLTSPNQKAAISHFEDLASATPTVKALRSGASDLANPNNSFDSYAIDSREVWARAYSQYVANKSSDVKMKSQLENYRYAGAQWPESEFQPLSDAIDGVFAGFKK